MKNILEKILPTLIMTILGAVVGAFIQIHDNRIEINKIIADNVQMEAKHNKRLDNLEFSRERMPDNYVTRREFNIVISALDERLKKVDKNIEKLLDLKMKSEK